jgi:hypothetical protein
MNATGKRARRATGLDRYGVHRMQHAVKSDAKRRRMNWTRGTWRRAA